METYAEELRRTMKERGLPDTDEGVQRAHFILQGASTEAYVPQAPSFLSQAATRVGELGKGLLGATGITPDEANAVVQRNPYTGPAGLALTGAGNVLKNLISGYGQNLGRSLTSDQFAGKPLLKGADIALSALGNPAVSRVAQAGEEGNAGAALVEAILGGTMVRGTLPSVGRGMANAGKAVGTKMLGEVPRSTTPLYAPPMVKTQVQPMRPSTLPLLNPRHLPTQMTPEMQSLMANTEMFGATKAAPAIVKQWQQAQKPQVPKALTGATPGDAWKSWEQTTQQMVSDLPMSLRMNPAPGMQGTRGPLQVKPIPPDPRNYLTPAVEEAEGGLIGAQNAAEAAYEAAQRLSAPKVAPRTKMAPQTLQDLLDFFLRNPGAR